MPIGEVVLAIVGIFDHPGEHFPWDAFKLAEGHQVHVLGQENSEKVFQRVGKLDSATGGVGDFDAGVGFRPLFNDCLILDRKSTRLNSSHSQQSRMPSSA